MNDEPEVEPERVEPYVPPQRPKIVERPEPPAAPDKRNIWAILARIAILALLGVVIWWAWTKRQAGEGGGEGGHE